MDLSKYLSLYLDECRQNLKQIRQLITQVSLDKEGIDQLFRHLHTIKGMSATMGYEAIATVAHRLEGQVVEVREGRSTFGRDMRLYIQEGLEQIKYNLTSLEKGQPLVPALRVRSDVLDELLDNLNELYIVSQRIKNSLQKQDYGLLTEQSHQLSQNLVHLTERVTSMRLTPLSFLTDRLTETLRELARQLGKKVEITVNGDELEIDRAVLEALDAPLTQILRNAIDHGLEEATTRLARGKNESGTIVISCQRVERHLQVTVSDDGQGLDCPAMLKIALEKQLISPEKAARLTPREQLFLCCLPGLSTNETTSAVSGRGVGMDIVKAQLENMGGRLDITSQPGLGTTFALELPLSLAMVQALLVEVHGQQLAVPMWQLTGTIIVEQESSYRGEAVKLSPLAAVLFPQEETALKTGSPALVVEDHAHYIAFAVDKILGLSDLIIKPLCDILTPLACYSGTSLLANGQPILILDLFQIILK